jgi:hypothetical protein
MPIYSFDCNEHGEFDKYFPRVCDPKTSQCPQIGCIVFADRVEFVRVSMQPDNLWHCGVMDKGVEINSKSQLDRLNKERGIIRCANRQDYESLKQMSKTGKIEAEEKENAEIRKVFEEGIKGAGVVDSFGQLRPEANVVQSSENINFVSAES